MDANRERAKRLLKHYLRTAIQSSGGHWDMDNDAEVDEFVDCIIDAAVEESQPEPMSRAEFVQLHADTITRFP